MEKRHTVKVIIIIIIIVTINRSSSQNSAFLSSSFSSQFKDPVLSVTFSKFCRFTFCRHLYNKWCMISKFCRFTFCRHLYNKWCIISKFCRFTFCRLLYNKWCIISKFCPMQTLFLSVILCLIFWDLWVFYSLAGERYVRQSCDVVLFKYSIPTFRWAAWPLFWVCEDTSRKLFIFLVASVVSPRNSSIDYHQNIRKVNRIYIIVQSNTTFC